jgi:DNA-binding PadR family transcriptional regulator
MPTLDPVVHGQLRLAALSILSRLDEADFIFLRDKIGATDGNLATHLNKLAEARYISVHKSFVDRKPHTAYRITERGRNALLQYVSDLRSILDKDFSE